jgi:hypothetical protein
MLIDSTKRHTIQVRLTSSQQDFILQQMDGTTCRTLTEYVRHLIQRKPVIQKIRNQSIDDAMAELLSLRKELSRLSLSYGLARELAQAQIQSGAFSSWPEPAESAYGQFLEKLEEIKRILIQLSVHVGFDPPSAKREVHTGL